jgi:hypothetical protein
VEDLATYDGAQAGGGPGAPGLRSGKPVVPERGWIEAGRDPFVGCLHDQCAGNHHTAHVAESQRVRVAERPRTPGPLPVRRNTGAKATSGPLLGRVEVAIEQMRHAVGRAHDRGGWHPRSTSEVRPRGRRTTSRSGRAGVWPAYRPVDGLDPSHRRLPRWAPHLAAWRLGWFSDGHPAPSGRWSAGPRSMQGFVSVLGERPGSESPATTGRSWSSP